jgi:MFS family permease
MTEAYNAILPLILIVAALIILAVLIKKFARLPNNITVLFLAQPLISASAPIMVFIGGILSTKMASNPQLVTLPLSLMVAGTASATIPAAMLAKKLGRRYASILGFVNALVGSIIAGFAVINHNFLLFSVAAFLIGLSTAFAQQLRFAAIESIDNEKDINKALSVLMFAGIFSALIGPEVAMLSNSLFADTLGFAGAFFGLTIMILLAMLIMLWFKNPIISTEEINIPARPLLTIIKQPIFIIALLAAALSYGLMSFIMTSTPLSMHQLHGHSLADTKWVIQSHIAAMYLPSLFTTWLSNRIGIKYILLIGAIMFALVVAIATMGHSVLHFWWALIVLGIAWNFLFFSGTSLLHLSYHQHEKHKVQAVNDFSIFSFQGASSLLAGWVLFNYGWSGVVYASIPFVIIMFVISIYYITSRKIPRG